MGIDGDEDERGPGVGACMYGRGYERGRWCVNFNVYVSDVD